MKQYKNGWFGPALLGLFALWTALVGTVDVRPIGPMDSEVGFAALNGWFHHLTGVHMGLYTLTDWLGLVPVAVCLLFAGIGAAQLIGRRRVDFEVLALGVYYLLVMAAYLLFEMVPINFRPVLIEGRLEASYPSSTTLLVLGVMPTLSFLARRRWRRGKAVGICADAFSVFMVAGRLVSGVHWLTDIVGAALLSAGLFCIYQAVVVKYRKKN